MCADFNWHLNRQGIQGKKGEKGDQGFSPVISEGQNTSDTYTLNITNEYETFETPNLRGQFSIEDRGGKYVLYDTENNTLSASDPIPATAESEGVVSRATEEDFLNIQETAAKFVNPYSLVNSIVGILDSPDESVIIRQNPDTMRTELLVDSSGTQGDIAQERAERIAADADLQSKITSEENARIAADGILGRNISNVASDLETEKQIRLAADTQQQQLIDAERQERETQDASLQSQLSTKLTADNIKGGSNVTITRYGNNVTINSTGGGGGGTTYIAGDGINIENDTISVKIDNQTIKSVDGVLHADFSEIGDEVNTLAGRMSTAESNITTLQGEMTDVTGNVEELQDKVKDLELFKFPNVTIIGEPTINNGQISNFSINNYLQFPFEFETKGRTWLLNGSFDTRSDVTIQQNIIDSLASVALAVRNGRLVLALSTNGTSFNLGEHTSDEDFDVYVYPNTKYYFKLGFNGYSYDLAISTDKQEWTPAISVLSDKPIASTVMTISSAGHPFGGIINLNDWNLTVASLLVWQGMDDVGISSRLDVNASNITETGINHLKEVLGLANIETLLNEILGNEEAISSLVNDINGEVIE